MAYPARDVEALSLSEIETNRVVQVVAIDTNDSELKNRLLAHGVVPGTTLKILKRAPLGCPIIISLLGFSLSLRLTEASAISVSFT